MGKNKRPSIKNDKQYEALRDVGMSKEKAARIANDPKSGKKEASQVIMKNGLKKNFMSKQKK